MTALEAEKQKFYGWRNVVLCFLVYFLVYGIVFYGFSVVFPAMVKAMGWKRGDASIAQTVRTLLIGFGSPVAGYMIGRWSVRTTLFAGGVLIVVGLVLISTVMTSVWQWTILWGVVVGFGLSLCGLVSLQSNMTYWFNKYRGTAIGIVMSGAAVGGFVSQPLFVWIVKEYGQWQIGWLLAAGISVVGMLSIFLLKNKPADYGQYQDNIRPEDAGKLKSAGKQGNRTYRTDVSWTLAEAIRSPQLWCMTVCTCMAASNLYMLVTHGVFHWTGEGLTTMQAAYVLSFYVLGSACGRFSAGWLADMIEGRWLLTAEFVLIAFTTFTFWQVTNMTMLVIAAFIFGLCYGTGLVVVPTLVGNYYGATNFPKINSFMYPFQYGISAIVPVFAGYTYDYTKSYDIAWITLLVLGLVAIVCAFRATPPRKMEAKSI